MFLETLALTLEQASDAEVVNIPAWTFLERLKHMGEGSFQKVKEGTSVSQMRLR